MSFNGDRWRGFLGVTLPLFFGARTSESSESSELDELELELELLLLVELESVLGLRGRLVVEVLLFFGVGCLTNSSLDGVLSLTGVMKVGISNTSAFFLLFLEAVFIFLVTCLRGCSLSGCFLAVGSQWMVSVMSIICFFIAASALAFLTFSRIMCRPCLMSL